MFYACWNVRAETKLHGLVHFLPLCEANVPPGGTPFVKGMIEGARSGAEGHSMHRVRDECMQSRCRQKGVCDSCCAAPPIDLGRLRRLAGKRKTASDERTALSTSCATHRSVRFYLSRAGGPSVKRCETFKCNTDEWRCRERETVQR